MPRRDGASTRPKSRQTKVDVECSFCRAFHYTSFYGSNTQCAGNAGTNRAGIERERGGMAIKCMLRHNLQINPSRVLTTCVPYDPGRPGLRLLVAGHPVATTTTQVRRRQRSLAHGDRPRDSGTTAMSRPPSSTSGGTTTMTTRHLLRGDDDADCSSRRRAHVRRGVCGPSRGRGRGHAGPDRDPGRRGRSSLAGTANHVAKHVERRNWNREVVVTSKSGATTNPNRFVDAARTLCQSGTP